ncbi:hypothetical protein JCM1840_004015 [Sporobolomyces johnsonii]
MHASFIAVACALFASVTLAAPLSTRAKTSLCSPKINGTIATEVIVTDYPRYAWYPDLYGGVSIVFPGDGYIPPAYFFHIWNDGGDDKYRLASNSDTSKCLSGRHGVLGPADCGSPLAAWTITCETCHLNSGSSCQFKATTVAECATVVAPDQPLNVATCKTTRDPKDGLVNVNGTQYFSFDGYTLD